MTTPGSPLPLQSMTGFATVRGQVEDLVHFTITAKSVNHRFLDLHLRLPPRCEALEMQVRRLLKERLRRGHIELALVVEKRTAAGPQLNADLLGAHIAAFSKAAELYGLRNEPDLNTLIRLPGVLSTESAVAPEQFPGFDAAVIEAMEPLLSRLIAARTEEGLALAADMRQSMLRIRTAGEDLERLAESFRVTSFDNLRSRLRELTQGLLLADDRVTTEAALVAERSDIAEEILRLKTHVDRFLALLDNGGELGKQLDFLLQELNREANTILSKTNGSAGTTGLLMTDLGLAVKIEIERTREQVQNIE